MYQRMSFTLLYVSITLLFVNDKLWTTTEIYFMHVIIRFAGLMNGQQCFCGSNYGRRGMSTSCTLSCTADLNNYCGSQEAMSIYSTGQKGIFIKYY